MSDELVSILVPTYNGERFIRAAVRSALSQSYREVEVLVGDDCSTDRTPELLAAVAAEDPRVRVIRHERNLGAFENPLVLLREARGTYVKFLLHDDVLATDCVRDMVRALSGSPTTTLAFSHRTVIGEDGRPLPDQLRPFADRDCTIPGKDLAEHVLVSASNVVGELTTVMFRRADVDPGTLWHTDGRRLDVLGDLVLCLDLLRRGDAWYSPRPLSRFRVHAGQRSHDREVLATGVADWVHVVDWGIRAGLLPTQEARRTAYLTTLAQLGVRARHLADAPVHPAVLEALQLTAAALAEVDGPPGEDLLGADLPLRLRARGAQTSPTGPDLGSVTPR